MITLSIIIQLIFLLTFFMYPSLNLDMNPLFLNLFWIISIFIGFLSFFKCKNNKKFVKYITLLISIFLTLLFCLGTFLDKM